MVMEISILLVHSVEFARVIISVFPSMLLQIIWEDYFKLMFDDVKDEVKLNFEDENLDAEIVIKDLFYLSMVLSWIAGGTTPQELGELKTCAFSVISYRLH